MFILYSHLSWLFLFISYWPEYTHSNTHTICFVRRNWMHGSTFVCTRLSAHIPNSLCINPNVIAIEIFVFVFCVVTARNVIFIIFFRCFNNCGWIASINVYVFASAFLGWFVVINRSTLPWHIMIDQCPIAIVVDHFKQCVFYHGRTNSVFYNHRKFHFHFCLRISF